MATNCSEEIFDNLCSLCQTQNKNTEGNLFCLDCHDYYCSKCIHFHTDIPALRRHKIIGKSEFQLQVVESSLPMVPIERCKQHVTKIVDMYCSDHKIVACHMCATLEHSSCRKLYVPDHIESLMELEDIIGFRKDCTDIGQATKERIQTVKENVKALKVEKENALKELTAFKKEIIVWLDDIERRAIEQLDVKYAMIENDWNAAITDLHKVTEDMDHYISKVNSAAQNQPQLFVCISLCKEIASLTKEKIQDIQPYMKDIRCIFTPCLELKSLIKSHDILGTSSIKFHHSQPCMPLKSFNNLPTRDSKLEEIMCDDATVVPSKGGNDVPALISDFPNRYEQLPLQQEVNEVQPLPPKNIHSYEDIFLQQLPSIPKETVLARALYDFDGINADELSFKKGDMLHVDKEPSQNSEWCFALHLGVGGNGYIPRNYVTTDLDSPQSQDWWFNITWKEAEKQLMLPGNHTGTFLVREKEEKCCMLSVRDFNQIVKRAYVEHYKIKSAYYIKPNKIFENMMELISHYKSNADGLCCKLVVACPKMRPLVQFRELETVETARESVKILNEIDGWCFGNIYAGKWKNTLDVIVKTLKPGEMSAKGFLAEAILMQKLQHNKIVKLLAVCTKDEPILIITECTTNRILLDYLRNDEGKLLKFNDLTDMAGQIADGMAYLETRNIVHRDLRAANILVGDLRDVKISGFGLARLIKEDVYEADEGDKFPVKWTDPDAARDYKFSIKSDVWSYGVVLYELITFGKVPYQGIESNDVIKNVQEGYRMPKPVNGPIICPDSYYEIMLKCWKKDTKSRPTFAYLHDYFKNYVVASEENMWKIYRNVQLCDTF